MYIYVYIYIHIYTHIIYIYIHINTYILYDMYIYIGLPLVQNLLPLCFYGQNRNYFPYARV